MFKTRQMVNLDLLGVVSGNVSMKISPKEDTIR